MTGKYEAVHETLDAPHTPIGAAIAAYLAARESLSKDTKLQTFRDFLVATTRLYTSFSEGDRSDPRLLGAAFHYFRAILAEYQDGETRPLD